MARSFVIASSQRITAVRPTAMENQTYFTMTCWCRPTTTEVRAGCIGKCDISEDGGPSVDWRMWSPNYRLFAWLGTSAYGYFGPLNTQLYTHIAYVFNGSGALNADRLKIYINGVLKTLAFVGTVPATTMSSVSKFAVGTLGDYLIYSTANYGNVRVYLSALSVDQVNSDMAGYLPVSPLLNWPLGMSSPEVDLSGNGYAGTLVNAPAIADHCPTKYFTSMGVGR